MSGPAPIPSVSRAFLYLTFAGAISVAVVVVYLGITGQIGAGIP